jgi:hypothetical protein
MLSIVRDRLEIPDRNYTAGGPTRPSNHVKAMEQAF